MHDFRDSYENHFHGQLSADRAKLEWCVVSRLFAKLIRSDGLPVLSIIACAAQRDRHRKRSVHIWFAAFRLSFS